MKTAWNEAHVSSAGSIKECEGAHQERRDARRLKCARNGTQFSSTGSVARRMVRVRRAALTRLAKCPRTSREVPRPPPAADRSLEHVFKRTLLDGSESPHRAQPKMMDA